MPEEVVRNAAWKVEKNDDGTYNIKDYTGEHTMEAVPYQKLKALGIVELVK